MSIIDDIKKFCLEENLEFFDDYQYDNDKYFTCVAISTINPISVCIKLTEFLIQLGYCNVSRLLKLVDFKSDGFQGKLFFMDIYKIS